MSYVISDNGYTLFITNGINAEDLNPLADDLDAETWEEAYLEEIQKRLDDQYPGSTVSLDDQTFKISVPSNEVNEEDETEYNLEILTNEAYSKVNEILD